MRLLCLISKRRVAGLAGTCALVLGGIAGAAVTAAGPAEAATCTAVPGTACVITGTASLGTGSLSATVPGSLTWSATLTGVGQDVVDMTAADQGYVVDDATGSGDGWNVTTSATTFSTGGGTPKTLADTGTFSTTGSITSATATTSPSQACTSTGDCTLPANSTTYPVAITTASSPSAFTIYNAASGTGIGSVNIGGSGAMNPVGWWIHVPGTTAPGTYTSTITINVLSGP